MLIARFVDFFLSLFLSSVPDSLRIYEQEDSETRVTLQKSVSVFLMFLQTSYLVDRSIFLDENPFLKSTSLKYQLCRRNRDRRMELEVEKTVQ